MQHSVGDFVWDNSGFLGEGSFGKVYKGKNKKTGEVVAVKVMDMSNFKDEYMKESLRNEIKVMGELNSPHVVRMLAVDGNPKETYIILEFCSDGDLDKFIEKHGNLLDEKLAREVLTQLMEGFKNLVDRGYIHRDIKPANALVQGKVFKVADFGFATKVDPRGRQLLRECVGTPLFMAPQLLENRPYTAKSDIWSIGMMYYMMLFGKTPWPCRSLDSFLRNIKTTPLRFPYEKSISKESKEFIQKSLTIDENQRLGWDEAFKHSVLNLAQAHVEQPTVKIDAKAQEILRSIQELVQAHNLDTRQIFANFDKDKQGSLDQNEFYKLLCVIDPRITLNESNYVFKIVDQSKDGHVSLQEFQAIFQQYDFSNLADKAQQVIIDLREIIKSYKQDVIDVFKKYDQDRGGSLNFKEFEQMLRIFAPKLRDNEIQAVFQKFDHDKDGTVTLVEFKRTLGFGTELDSKFDPKREKANRVVKELKRIIQEHKLDLKKIFANFDKSKDNKLDLNEFTKLLQVIDKQLPQEEITYVFKLFDQTGGGDIDFNEFAKVLN